MVKPEEVLTGYRCISTRRVRLQRSFPFLPEDGDNTDELGKGDHEISSLPGPQFYDEDTVTDQPERQIVAELIREKALHCSAGGDPAWGRCGDRPDEDEPEEIVSH